MVLVPNETWWGKTTFKRVIMRVISNTAALEANLISGGIDMISGDLGITIDQALASENAAKNYTILYKSGLIYEHLDLNLTIRSSKTSGSGRLSFWRLTGPPSQNNCSRTGNPLPTPASIL